jgi:hypothetical protein
MILHLPSWESCDLEELKAWYHTAMKRYNHAKAYNEEESIQKKNTNNNKNTKHLYHFLRDKQGL